MMIMQKHNHLQTIFFIFKQLNCAYHAISVKTFGQQLFCSLEIWFYDFVNVFFILVLVVMQKRRRLLLRDNLGVKDGRFCNRNRKGYLMDDFAAGTGKVT